MILLFIYVFLIIDSNIHPKVIIIGDYILV